MSPTEYTESRGYSMHSCVHAWTRHVLNETESNDLAQLAIICVSSKIPKDTEQKYYTLQRRLLGHAAFCSTTILNGTPVTQVEEWTLKGLGDLFRNMALFQEAEAMYERALQGGEKAFGPDHPSILDPINNLGNLYRDQGRVQEAETLYRRAL